MDPMFAKAGDVHSSTQSQSEMGTLRGIDWVRNVFNDFKCQKYLAEDLDYCGEIDADFPTTWHQIPFTELGEFAEVFTVGTASSLVPVSSITRESTGHRFEYDVNKTSPESAHARLTDRLQGIKRGLYSEPWGWVEELGGGKLQHDVRVDANRDR
ncbi:branched-chain-amino-acid aminotransferase [Colletotrichum tofieldiae]|nr:branched-chain-amino-acid aminotransferase [Colletotrichum tofieldiae]